MSSRLSLLTAQARRQLLVDFRGRRVPRDGPDTVEALVAAQAARTPEATAVVGGGQRLTYGELDARANRLAHRLRARGVGPEVRVGVAMRRSPSLVVALLGILRAGGAYVPIDVAYPPKRGGIMVGDARARI